MFKRDELGLPGFWALQIIGWSFFYLLIFISLLHYLNKRGEFLANTVFVLAMFAASCALRPVARALSNRPLSWMGREARAFAWSVPFGLVAGVLPEVVVLDIGRFDWGEVIVSAMQASIMLFLWCSLYFSIKQWQRSARERERLLRAETEVREARLSALHYQLNPHFLFNSLNAVSTLVLDGNAPAATRMLSQIGELLRTTLDRNVSAETPLSEEIAFTEQYLAIEQTRLGGRLQVTMHISPETLDALVPSMLLQPLVENAVRHGVAPRVEDGTICILSDLRRSRLHLVIRNSGAPLEAEAAKSFVSNGNGIGLPNTVERLKTLYGADCKFILECPDEGGCQVTVELPFRKPAHLQEVSSCAR